MLSGFDLYPRWVPMIFDMIFAALFGKWNWFVQMHGKRLPRVEFSSPEFCLPLAQNANPQPPVWNLDISNHNITKSSV